MPNVSYALIRGINPYTMWFCLLLKKFRCLKLKSARGGKMTKQMSVKVPYFIA